MYEKTILYRSRSSFFGSYIFFVVGVNRLEILREEKEKTFHLVNKKKNQKNDFLDDG
jgi:hypothetical protein